VKHKDLKVYRAAKVISKSMIQDSDAFVNETEILKKLVGWDVIARTILILLNFMRNLKTRLMCIWCRSKNSFC
jgi:hypothetical protein